MTAALLERELAFGVFHLCAGIGGGALGFAAGHARVGRTAARFVTLGGVDVDPVACADFEAVVGVPCAELDLFSRDQYIAFHGREPPPSWREATADDLRRAAGGRRPDVVFTSPPCKGLSSLQTAERAASARYQALNELVIRSLELVFEAWGDDPPSLILLENVPRIMTRGRPLLDRVKLLLDVHGYASAETVHDCGELGGLAQHRQRFLLVARHRQKVRPFLYEPDRRRVRGVGEVLGDLPMPDDVAGGPMHKLPRLEWRTWVRLALIEAGSDWRSLNKLEVVDGHLRDIGIAPVDAAWHAGVLGVRGWDQPATTITGRAGPTTGAYVVADPRSPRDLGRYEPYGVVPWTEPSHAVTGEAAPGAGPYTVADPRVQAREAAYGVLAWDETAPTVIGVRAPGQGRYSVADPRPRSPGKHYGKHRVEAWDAPAHTVTGSDRVGSGAQSIADPRSPTRFNNVFTVVRWDEAAGAITCGMTPTAGGQAVADPRVGCKHEGGDFASARHYGVLRWADTSPAVTGSACHDNGAHSVADPRSLPAATERCNPWIWSLDRTRHRPFTTLELAALQGYPVLGEAGPLVLSGTDSLRREHIGNSVPVATAAAIASTMLQTLLMAAAGHSFALSSSPIWVDRRLAMWLSADLPELRP